MSIGLQEMEMKMKTLRKSSTAVFVLFILSLSCNSNVVVAEDCWIGTWASGQQLTER